jgi:hypothetical protein
VTVTAKTATVTAALETGSATKNANPIARQVQARTSSKRYAW